jgi:hypothetical protein
VMIYREREDACESHSWKSHKKKKSRSTKHNIATKMIIPLTPGKIV